MVVFFGIIVLISIIALISNAIILILNIYEAIAYYRKPEYYCAKCGKEVNLKVEKCPKCKTILKEGKV